MKLTEIKAEPNSIEKIKDFCKANEVEIDTISSGGIVNTDNLVSINYFNGSVLPVKFGKVGGFWIDNVKQLTSLVGFPTYIKNRFSFHNCPRVTSLKELKLTYVGGYLNFENLGITSLEGLPKEINGHIWIDSCHALKNLDFLPKKIKGSASFGDCELVKDIYKLVAIRGCTEIELVAGIIPPSKARKLEKILNKWLATHDTVSCQDELMDIPELAEYAEE